MRIRIVAPLLVLLLSFATAATAQYGEALYQRALIQLDSGDIEGAIQSFNRVVKEHSYDRRLVAQTLLKLGECLQVIGQPAKAWTYYEQVISQYSDQTAAVASARKRQAAATAIADVPKGWKMAGSKPADYESGVDLRTSFSGLSSGYLTSKQPIVDGYGTLMQSFSAEYYLGTRLRLKAWVRSENVQQWAGLWMRVDGQSGGMYLAFDNMEDRPIKGTTDWREYQVVLDVSPEASAISIGIALTGTGTVWMAGSKVEQVDGNVPTTGTAFKDRGRRLPKDPTNLGFDKK